MTGVATHLQETIFQAAASEVVLELLFDIPRQRPTLRNKMVLERGIVLFNKLVKQPAFRVMEFADCGMQNPSETTAPIFDAAPNRTPTVPIQLGYVDNLPMHFYNSLITQRNNWVTP